MKLYKVTFRCDSAATGIEAEWYGSLAEAKKALAEVKRGDFYEGDGEVQPVEFATSKAGLLLLLNVHAGNG